jgi:dsDNA-specific endonuclease/ATPase MutS2
MNDQAFKTLEYHQLLELVKRGGQTEMGRARITALTPLDDLEELRRELSTVSECVSLRNRGVNWSFSEFADPTETISRLRIEGNSLDSLAILETARLCEQALSARSAILAERDEAQCCGSWLKICREI